MLLLPYLERNDIYKKYNFDEPWDGPNNSKLHDIMMPYPYYRCPTDKLAGKETDTSYVVVVGPGTVFPGERPVKLGEIRDGSSNTVMLVEVANSGIHWMEPRDLDITKMAATGKPARTAWVSPASIRVLSTLSFVDGSVHSFDKEELTMGRTQSAVEPRRG